MQRPFALHSAFYITHVTLIFIENCLSHACGGWGCIELCMSRNLLTAFSVVKYMVVDEVCSLYKTGVRPNPRASRDSKLTCNVHIDSLELTEFCDKLSTFVELKCASLKHFAQFFLCFVAIDENSIKQVELQFSPIFSLFLAPHSRMAH